jgi:polynucleotide 5'-triphosphatase
LGAWEQSIQNCLPQDEISKIVADWLFRVVANREDAGELASRGVEVEVEAKFGQIIDKDTNDRIRYPIQSECVLIESNRTIFRSSMTEVCKINTGKFSS